MIDNMQSEEKLKVEKIKVTKAIIVVSGNSVKPYFSILYNEVGKDYDKNGFGSYCLDTVFQWRYENFEIVDEEEQQADKWIPCEERLPEERLQSVIGWDEYRQRCCLVRYDKEWILGNYDSVKITYWQPLPTQPHKKEGAE